VFHNGKSGLQFEAYMLHNSQEEAPKEMVEASYDRDKQGVGQAVAPLLVYVHLALASAYLYSPPPTAICLDHAITVVVRNGTF
jgi:hypothetical protein